MIKGNCVLRLIIKYIFLNCINYRIKASYYLFIHLLFSFSILNSLKNIQTFNPVLVHIILCLYTNLVSRMTWRDLDCNYDTVLIGYNYDNHDSKYRVMEMLLININNLIFMNNYLNVHKNSNDTLWLIIKYKWITKL